MRDGWPCCCCRCPQPVRTTKRPPCETTGRHISLVSYPAGALIGRGGAAGRCDAGKNKIRVRAEVKVKFQSRTAAGGSTQTTQPPEPPPRPRCSCWGDRLIPLVGHAFLLILGGALSGWRPRPTTGQPDLIELVRGVWLGRGGVGGRLRGGGDVQARFRSLTALRWKDRWPGRPGASVLASFG